MYCEHSFTKLVNIKILGFQDFPSLSFIDDILNEKRISTIFTVTDNVKDLYTNINEIIRNAIVGNLVGDSFDLVREVEDLFKVSGSFA